MSLRITSTAAVLAITVGVMLAGAPAALAAPPQGTVLRSTLISQGYTCTPNWCTKSGSPAVFYCSGELCTLRV